MKIISMKQLREKFNPIRKGLERGEEYLLLYRSKPLAVMTPYKKAEQSQKSQSFKPATFNIKAEQTTPDAKFEPQQQAKVSKFPKETSFEPAPIIEAPAIVEPMQKTFKPDPKPISQPFTPNQDLPPAPIPEKKDKSVLNKFGMRGMLMPK